MSHAKISTSLGITVRVGCNSQSLHFQDLIVAVFWLVEGGSLFFGLTGALLDRLVT